MKKNKESLVKIWKAVGICLIIFFLFWAFLIYPNYHFNPEKDICIKNECNCVNFDGSVPQDNRCLEWRPKSKCELNPDDVDCVCDEREQKEICMMEYGTYTYNTSKELRDAKYEEGTDGCTDISPYCIKKTFIYLFNDEIISVESTPDILLEYLNATLLNVQCVRKEWRLVVTNGSCIKSHERGLSDLSCPELLDYYENGNECIKRQYPIWIMAIYNPCVQYKYPKMRCKLFGMCDHFDKQILSEYIKGCI